MARGLKFWIKVEEGLYYPCSENKGADQLRGYSEADLRLCFRICKKAGFLTTLLIWDKIKLMTPFQAELCIVKLSQYMLITFYAFLWRKFGKFKFEGACWPGG